MGLCPLHHVASAVPVPFLPALRYSPSSDPDPLRTPLELHALLLGLCCFLLLSLLPPPGPSLLVLAAGLRLLSSPFVPVRSSAFSARFAACVFFGVSFVAPFLFGLLMCLLVVFLSALAGLLLPHCCWICGLCLLPAY